MQCPADPAIPARGTKNQFCLQRFVDPSKLSAVCALETKNPPPRQKLQEILTLTMPLIVLNELHNWSLLLQALREKHSQKTKNMHSLYGNVCVCVCQFFTAGNFQVSVTDTCQASGLREDHMEVICEPDQLLNILKFLANYL